MSEITDRLREEARQAGFYMLDVAVDPELLAAAVDVIDAAETHENTSNSPNDKPPSAYALEMAEADTGLYEALSRFREVAE